MSIEVLLTIGAVIFSISSLVFFFLAKKKFNTAMLVSMVTFTSYVLMLTGDFTSTTADGEAIYYTRWLFYGFSCALLVYEMAKRLGKSAEEIAQLVYLTVIVMITGMFAAMNTELLQVLFFAVSTFAYIILLMKLLQGNKPGPLQSQASFYTLLFWTAFPVVFVLSPVGLGVVSVVVAQGIYLVLDLITKIAFYFTADLLED